MEVSTYYPYRSEADRDRCYSFFESLGAKAWPAESEERTIPTSFGGAFVRIVGRVDAPPLVLLPGAAATSLMWAPNVGILAQEFRVIAVDRVSELGRSACTRPPQSFDDLTEWLKEVLDGLGLGKVYLGGISYGGAQTANFVLRYPDRVMKAILIAPACTVSRLNTWFVLRFAWAAIKKEKVLPTLMRWMFRDLAKANPTRLAEIIEELTMNMTCMQRRKIPLPRVLTDAEWASFPTPALFLLGEHEVIYSPKKAVARLHRVAPQVRTEIIPGAGHDLTIVQADLVSRRMVEFLRDVR